MILAANEMNHASKIRVGLYGIPGVAKSTTGLSAPGVLFIDSDDGWRRIPAHVKRASRINPRTYGEVLDDLASDAAKPFETVVVDTGGALLNKMKAWAIANNAKNGQGDGVTLSMKGYGAVGQEFERLCNYIHSTLGKNLVMIFHAKEEMDNEKKVFRLDVEGQTKNNIWKSMDIFGFMEVDAGKIYVGFSPTDRYQAKATQGVSGRYELPNVMKGAPNDFLTKIFGIIQDSAKEELAMVAKYDSIMEKTREVVGAVKTPEDADKALEYISSTEHVFTSERESKALLKGMVDDLGIVYNGKSFESKVAAPAAEVTE